MPDIGGINLSATNFADTVRAYIERERIAMLRADNTYALPESVVNVSPNEDGISFSRKLTAWADIPAGNSGLGTALVEGTPPSPRKLNEDSITFSVAEVGDYIPVFSQAAQQYGVAKAVAVAADKAARMQQLVIDNLARSLYAAATPDIFSGGASSNATLVAGNVLTTATVDEMVTEARSRDLQPFSDGLFRFVGHPRLFKALFTEAASNGGAFLNAANHGTVGDLTKGVVGDYHGARFISAGSRGITTASVDGPALSNAGNAAIAATDLITTSNNHGLVAGNRIKITALTGGAGLTAGNTYYVVAPVTATTFKLSATKNGAAIDITTDSTAFTANQVNDVYTGVLVGKDAIALADVETLQTFVQKGGGPGDPLEQTVATIGFRGFTGGALVSLANFADGAGAASADVVRSLTVRSVGSVAA